MMTISERNIITKCKVLYLFFRYITLSIHRKIEYFFTNKYISIEYLHTMVELTKPYMFDPET